MNRKRILVVLAALSLSAGPARADWSSCLAGLRQSAAAAGVSHQTVARALGSLEPNDAVSFMDKQPEFSTPVWDYIAGLVDEERVEEGRAGHAGMGSQLKGGPCHSHRLLIGISRRGGQ